MATKKKQSKTESFRVSGQDLAQKVREIISEGNARKITILDKNGKEIMRFPLTIGILGTAAAPVFAAIGAIAALITECTITVERDEEV